jgi:hypothetical protein
MTALLRLSPERQRISEHRSTKAARSAPYADPLAVLRTRNIQREIPWPETRPSQPWVSKVPTFVRLTNCSTNNAFASGASAPASPRPRLRCVLALSGAWTGAPAAWQPIGPSANSVITWAAGTTWVTWPTPCPTYSAMASTCAGHLSVGCCDEPQRDRLRPARGLQHGVHLVRVRLGVGRQQRGNVVRWAPDSSVATNRVPTRTPAAGGQRSGHRPGAADATGCQHRDRDHLQHIGQQRQQPDRPT